MSQWGCCSRYFNTLAFGWWLWQHSTYSDAPVPAQLLQALKVLSMSQYYLYVYSMIIHSQLSLTVQCVPWVRVTICFIIWEVCYSIWWWHISQQLNTSEYTVYNIYGFPYFFKSGITSWGSCAQIWLHPLCACVRKHACVYRYGYIRYFSLMREGTHKGPRIWNVSLTIWYDYEKSMVSLTTIKNVSLTINSWFINF